MTFLKFFQRYIDEAVLHNVWVPFRRNVSRADLEGLAAYLGYTVKVKEGEQAKDTATAANSGMYR